MSETTRFCERCTRMTKHKAEVFLPSQPNPIVEGQNVDLTGRGVPAQTPRSPLPHTVKYTCAVCGYVTVVVGGDQQTGSGGVFDRLERGTDWAAPAD